MRALAGRLQVGPMSLERYPNMAAVMAAVVADPAYDFGAEFEACLDLVLDGIARWRTT